MRRTLIVVLIIMCMMTASPALAHNKAKSRKHHRHHAAIVKPAYKTASMFTFDYSKAAPSAKVEQRHLDAAIAIRAELDKTALPDVTLFGVEFWAQGLADQEAAR